MNVSSDTIEQFESTGCTAETVENTSVSSRKPDNDRRRILLVDDEESILRSLRRLLRRENYEVITAGSGPDALTAMEECPAELIVSDQRMPGMTGTELLGEVRSRWPDTIRVILSGYSEINAIIDAVNDGEIYKYITKPWNDEELKLNIRRALEQYELKAQNQRMAKMIEQQNTQLRRLNEQLEQRASDVSAGMTCIQELLEHIDAGVIVVDSQELIVSANRRVGDIIELKQPEFVGMTASTALPEKLYKTLYSTETSEDVAVSGRLELVERRLQWRCRELVEKKQGKGRIITIWEEVQ